MSNLINIYEENLILKLDKNKYGQRHLETPTSSIIKKKKNKVS